ncbi:MAG TPA: hypothetical protein VJT33_14730 [bacterium]|nr:hypothetical protein [bacterium]
MNGTERRGADYGARTIAGALLIISCLALGESARVTVQAATGYTGEILVRTQTSYKSTTETSTAVSTTETATTTCDATYTLAGSQSRVSVKYSSHYERRAVRGTTWERDVENFNGTVTAAYNPNLQIAASGGVGHPYHITYKPFLGQMQGTDTIDRPEGLQTHPIAASTWCRDDATVSGTHRTGQNNDVYDDQVTVSGHFGRREFESGTKTVSWRISGPSVVP